MSRRSWTPEEISKLGVGSAADVAKTLSRSRASVLSARLRFGIDAFEPQPDADDSIYDWEQCSKIDQRHFIDEIKRHIGSVLGREASYRDISRICYYALPRVQAWATTGPSKVQLPISARHHIWLAAMNIEE